MNEISLYLLGSLLRIGLILLGGWEIGRIIYWFKKKSYTVAGIFVMFTLWTILTFIRSYTISPVIPWIV